MARVRVGHLQSPCEKKLELRYAPVMGYLLVSMLENLRDRVIYLHSNWVHVLVLKDNRYVLDQLCIRLQKVLIPSSFYSWIG